MVKVNQAAILLASPGQPRHQPIKQQNLPIPKYLHRGKKQMGAQKILKTRINPSSLPGSSPVGPCCCASKKQKQNTRVQRKRFQAPSYPKVREDQYPQPCFFLSAGVPSLHGTVLHNGHSAMCARLRACFGAELGASVRHGCSSLVYYS